MIRSFTALLIVLLVVGCAQGPVQSTGIINTHTIDGVENVAIKGYDTVAYVRDKKAVKGTKKYQHKWKGATWFFGNNFNRRQFIKKPWMFAPKYGGFSAYDVAVSKEKADVDPMAWHVKSNNLYLNNSKKTQDMWLKNRDEYIKQGNKNWSMVKQQKTKKR